MTEETTQDNNKMWADDLFNRKQYADFLTNYLLNKENFVLNINAEWGAGKTFFIDHWAKDLKEKYPTVIFNAWKHDFTEEPLLALVSAITRELCSLLDQDGAKKKSEDWTKKGTKVVTKLLPILAKGLIKKAIGQQEGEALLQLTAEDESTAENITEALTKSFNKEISAIEDFQIGLKNLLNEIETNSDIGEKLPLFVLIDELDRCRPLFAIELLERVKHLFNMPDIHFIISTDTKQLAHSVCAIYGEKFDGRTYLRRFFDQEFTLPAPSNLDFAKVLFKNFDSQERSMSHDFSQQGRSEKISTTKALFIPRGSPKNMESILVFYALTEIFSLDLRTQKQCYERIEGIVNNLSGSGKIGALFTIYLVLIKEKFPDFFEEIFKPGYQGPSFPNNTERGINSVICYKRFRNTNDPILVEEITLASIIQEYFKCYKKKISKEIFDNMLSEGTLGSNREINNIIRNIDSIESIESYPDIVRLATQLE
ncbi:KAP family P-loop NTPase fold protein [Desulfotalea psychrophila]|uniref:KAP NTPase domain-containing protein n=1 Tax=Desulfotalea psychrophila (strain LSv54 / DSM 12343) TaxID=177439 RepID=Q6AMY1_DESPS|nr:P-loop NTPase fold protein [Desulfotalea psychrophila]CAG36293.1 unknown protein [Desulfotalea psychrophila LSv54]